MIRQGSGYAHSLLYIVHFLLFPLCQAQTGATEGSRYGKGEDSIRCMTNLSLYRDYYRQRDYPSALPFWRQVFDECPMATKNIYIDGGRMYREMADRERTPSIQAGLADTIILLYDRRISYFPEDRGSQLGRRGVDLLRYHKDNTDVSLEVFKNLSESMAIEKEKTPEVVLNALMVTATTLYNERKIELSDLIVQYVTAKTIVAQQLAIQKQNSRLETVNRNIDNSLRSVNMVCGPLESKLEVRFNETSKNPTVLHILAGLLESNGCTSSEIYYQVSIYLFEQMPTADKAAALGQLAAVRKELDTSIAFYLMAIEMENDSIRLATCHLKLAEALLARNRKAEARENALFAARYRSNWGDPYLLIGRMYIESQDECGQISLPKALFWIATDKFRYAAVIDPRYETASEQLISTYSKYFPTREEAFFLNLAEGDVYLVECWIKERTRVRF